MAYDTKDLKNKAPGLTQETSDKSTSAGAGVYEHPTAVDENGNPQQIITLHDPLFGDAQSEGVVRLGFVFKRPATAEDVKTIIGNAKDAKEYEKSHDASVTSRVDQLELESLRAFKARKEAEEAAEKQTPASKDADELIASTAAKAEEARVEPAFDESAQTARSNAEKQVELRQQKEVPTAPELEEPVAEKPLSKQNSTELKATAEAEGVEVTEELDTNKKLVAAIQAKRDETKGE